MAKRNLTEKLIDKNDIHEELRYIEGSTNAYITPTGKVYIDYGSGKYYPKKNTINGCHGYEQVGIQYTGKEHLTTKRVHILVAKAYIPNPENFPVVHHIDGNKTNNKVENLKWVSVVENTKATYDAGYQQPSGWIDDQSVPVVKLDLNGNYITTYGSVGEASRETGMTKTGILHQCKHKVTTKPRKGFYYRYLSEYEEKGFIL